MNKRSVQQIGLLLLGVGILAALWLPGLNKDTLVREVETMSGDTTIHGHEHDHADSDENAEVVGPDSYKYALSLAEDAQKGSVSAKISAALLIDSISSLLEDEKLSGSLHMKTEALLTEALKQEPENTDALNNLAMIDIYRKEDVMNGVQKLLKVVKLDKNNEMALFQLGVLAIKSGQTDKAIERFEKLVSLQPQNKEYHKNLALLYNQKGNTAQAERHAALAK